MINHEKYTELIQWHNAIEFFDYNPAIDWAMEFIKRGTETENLLIVASFSKPVDSYEIKPYISGAIRDLNLEEKYGAYSIIANIHYHLELILEDYETRLNLRELYKLCVNTNYEFGLTTFYLLHHAWLDLEEDRYNYYYKGVTLDNIDRILKKQAKNWIDRYVLGIENEMVENTSQLNVPKKTKSKNNSIWTAIKKVLAKK